MITARPAFLLTDVPAQHRDDCGDDCGDEKRVNPAMAGTIRAAANDKIHGLIEVPCIPRDPLPPS